MSYRAIAVLGGCLLGMASGMSFADGSEADVASSEGAQPIEEVVVTGVRQRLYQAGTLEEEKLKPIFDNAQWRAIKQLLAQGKAMEAHLKSNGFVP